MDIKFKQLIKLAANLPRTNVFKSEENYWKAVCHSLIFRFPDDLEILMLRNKNKLLKNGFIQIKSASRFGQSDLGVNRRRVELLIRQLKNI